MPLSARLLRDYIVQAKCECCPEASVPIIKKRKAEAYDMLEHQGWLLFLGVRMAVCPSCAEEIRRAR